MDRSRQMPNSTEQQSSSDDLIAELARLMAEEAEGERNAALEREKPPPPQAEEPKPEPQAPVAAQADEPEHKLPDSGNVVRIPGSRSSSSATTPAGSVWGRSLDTPEAANNDLKDLVEPDAPIPVPASATGTLPETHVEPRLPAEGAPSEPGTANVKPFFSAYESGSEKIEDPLIAGVAEPDFLPDAPMSADTAGMAEENPFNTGTIGVGDPIAELITEQAREEAAADSAASVQPEPESFDSSPAPETPQARSSAPEMPIVPSPFVAGASQSRVVPRDEPAEPQAEPKKTESGIDSDVLSLLRAMDATRNGGERAQKSKTDDDQFSASPIFGLGSVSPVEAKTSDPLEEIESLIGDAVRFSNDKQTTAPGAEAEPDLDDAALAAEAAIAAATAETARPMRPQHRLDSEFQDFGTRPGDSVSASTSESSNPDTSTQPSSRLLVGAAAAATLLVAVALGLFWMFGLNADPTGEVPVLASNTTDAKETVATGTAAAETSQPAIFDELDGTAAEVPTDEQIVSRDQSDSITEDVRQVATPETADDGLANRKVRTVTVRPDGTIVSSDETLAANEILPVVRPDVPTLSGETGTEGDFQVSATPAGAETAAGTAGQTAAVEETAADPLAAIVENATAEADGPADERVANAPFPASRPVTGFNATTATTPTQTTQPEAIAVTSAPATGTGGTGDTIDLIAGVANQVASQLPTATTTAASTPQTTASAPPVTASSGPDAPAYVQLSSQRSEEAARSTLGIITDRYRGLFNGAEAFVRQVDLGERGIYYRVLVPASSQADANGVCASVKAAGGDCFVRNN